MKKELLTLADKIKTLREQAGLTQAEVARQLGISRAGVNAWEMGLSVPSTPYVVELAKKFGVSTDYLLGMEDTATISVKGLSQKQVTARLRQVLFAKRVPVKQEVKPPVAVWLEQTVR